MIKDSYSDRDSDSDNDSDSDSDRDSQSDSDTMFYWAIEPINNTYQIVIRYSKK